MLREGELGIHPPGALGVAFFVHAGAECFIGRCDDGITDTLKKASALRLDDGGTLRTVSVRNRIFSNLLEAAALDRMPEVLFVCCNPDQLGLFTGELTRFLENLAQRDRLRSLEDLRRHVPILLILPNGILAEQTSRTYEEQIRESLLMGRLPGVTPDMTTALLERVVRGISLQAGGRRGSGVETTYVLERKGRLLFAGGGDWERERIETVLGSHDYPYRHARGVPGTRIEFDKAMISIVLNVGGLIHTVKPDGDLIDLRMGDLCKDPSQADFVHQITRAVFDVGQAVGAYPPDAAYDDVWAGHHATILAHAGHVTSSLKMFRDQLTSGLSSVRLFSNEEWILTPLARYAAQAGLSREESLFRSLRQRVQESMARAIRFRDHDPKSNGLRADTMRLAAQRNFSIDLYDAGSDDMVLVASMLDDEHLIKLEVTVHLPDEQITKSRLNMIRAPFPVCREVEGAAERLVGLRIERGVLHQINDRLGGRLGCSHIKELATNIVYFAASHLVRRRSGLDPMSTDYAFKPPEERFLLTKELLRDSCLAYCQTTPQGLDEQIGIRRVGEEHANPLPLGQYEPSLGVLLQERAERWCDKTFMRYRVDDQEFMLTWTEFADRVWQIARHMIEHGIRPGDRVCMLSENRAEMVLCELAVMSIGAVTVPVFAGYPPPQIAYVLGHARPRYLVVSGKHQLDKIEIERYPWVEKCYCMDFDQDCRRWGALDFAELTQPGGASEAQLQERINAVQPDDLCLVMYTSGTTGPPKGVQLCHRNLISQQKAVSLLWDVSDSDVLMAYLPWHHSFGGLFERGMALYHGCELCLDDSRGRDVDRMIDNWRAYDPTIFFSVPRVHELLMARCRQDPTVAQLIFGGRLRFVFSAGAPLPAKVEAEYRERGVPVLEGWGLTETSPCTTVTTKETPWKSGYVGFPIPGVSIRVESDQEILVKGPNVMLGYLNDEEATAQVFDSSGWFRSGDLGEFTGDGLRLFGRKDGAFKLTTGEKVHPQRVENVLVNESPYINLAVVLGSGRDHVGAIIYPDASRVREWAASHGVEPGQALAHPDFRALIVSELQRLNPMIEVKYQRVRRAALADHEPSLARGELTPSGKIVRKAVLHANKAKVDALFAPEPTDDVLQIPETQPERTYARAT
jgi:long-subunit acyl-CoA synthetase (AMP-forming)